MPLVLTGVSSGGAVSSSITGAVGYVMEVVATVMTTIAANPVLMAFMVAGLVGVAIAIVRKLVGRY